MSYPPLTDDERRMVEDNTGLVGTVVYRWLRLNGPLAEDAMQDGMLGLMRAAQKFDPSLGFTFSTYAMAWIRQSIGRGREAYEGRNLARANRNGEEWNPPTSLDAARDGIALATALAAADDPERDTLDALERDERRAVLAACCKDDIDRMALRARLEGCSFQAIAGAAGVSHQTIRVRLDRLGSKARHPTSRARLTSGVTI